MFFSSAITFILPYLLFFGVLTTFFYGIAEKTGVFSIPDFENSEISKQNLPESEDQNKEYFYWKDYRSYNQSHIESEQKSQTTNHPHFNLEKAFSISCIHFDYKDFTFRHPYSIYISYYSLRGPPNLG